MTPTFYKATRLDRRDFRTGKVLYEVGLMVEHPSSARFRDMRPNGPATYLSVSLEPGEVLTGGWWPCRLFEVDPVGRVVKRTDGMYPWKRGCRSLRVVREVEAWRALGPNGERVAALIERAGRLTYDEVTALRAARGAARGAAQDAAWGAARGAARGAAQDAAWGAARGAAWGAARGAAWGAAQDAAQDAAWGAAQDAAWGAAWGAVLGLLVQDLITPDQFDRLYGPWREVVES